MAAEDGDGTRIVLDNGVVVLLRPVEGMGQVALEAIYRVGFLHEPKGMTQVAHLVEHLVCQGATENFEAGRALARVNEIGMANAETLADFTHYDYVLPARELELALRIEAERLSSLRIESPLVGQEAPKCYQETDFVEANPQAGMLKHAFMAFNQAWRHRARTALVRGGLEQFALADIEAFHARFYRPANLVLVIVGAFDKAEAIDLLEKHLSTVLPEKAEAVPPTDWADLPKEMTIVWDSKVAAVCAAFPPPAATGDRIVLSLWGNLVMQRLSTAEAINELSDAVFTSNQSWPVGVLPFFVYATARSQVEPSKLRAALEGEVLRLVEAGPTTEELKQIRLMASALVRPMPLSRQVIHQQADMLARQMGVTKERATGMMLGNVALQLGVRELLLSGDGQRTATTLTRADDQALRGIVRRCLPASKQFITTIEPMRLASQKKNQ
jgi:predicted Zn-dependent peptidase